MAMSTGSPCAACKLLRRKCTPECAFAPYFPPEDPQKFANVHKLFGASNVCKLLSELPPCARDDAASSLAYEAEARVKDPVYGCAGAIAILQSRVAQLQAELVVARSELWRLKRDAGGNDAQFQCKPSPDNLPLPSYHHHPPQPSSPPVNIYPSSASSTTSYTINHAPSAISSICSPNPQESAPCTQPYNLVESSAFLIRAHIPQSTSLANHAEASSSLPLSSSAHSFFNILHSSPSSTFTFSDITSSVAVGEDCPSRNADRRHGRSQDARSAALSIKQANPIQLGLQLLPHNAKANRYDMQDSSSSSDAKI